MMTEKKKNVSIGVPVGKIAGRTVPKAPAEKEKLQRVVIKKAK